MERIFLPTPKLTVTGDDHIWVDSNFLRRFFSCRDGLDDIFQSALESSSFLHSKTFHCEHSSGLHPVVARKGKLLPSSLYNLVEGIMQEEHSTYLNDLSNNVSSLPHVPLFLEKLVECQECGKSYQMEARKKLEFFKVSG